MGRKSESLIVGLLDSCLHGNDRLVSDWGRSMSSQIPTAAALARYGSCACANSVSSGAWYCCMSFPRRRESTMPGWLPPGITKRAPFASRLLISPLKIRMTGEYPFERSRLHRSHQSTVRGGMKIRNGALLLGIFALGTYATFKTVTADAPGYCRAQGRYIEDNEFVAATIAIVERDRELTDPPDADGKREKRKNSRAVYQNWDFDAGNENCCYVSRKDTFPIVKRLFGFQQVVVFINPKTHTLPVFGSDHQLLFFWDVCGGLMDSSINLPDGRFPIVTTKNIGEHSGQ